MNKRLRDKTREAFFIKTWAQEEEEERSYDRFRTAMILLALGGIFFIYVLMIAGCVSA